MRNRTSSIFLSWSEGRMESGSTEVENKYRVGAGGAGGKWAMRKKDENKEKAKQDE